MPINDNDAGFGDANPQSQSAHGRAALLLVESLIHELCENETLSIPQTIEIVERAASVQADLAEAAGGAGAPLWKSHALLMEIGASLEWDRPITLD